MAYASQFTGGDADSRRAEADKLIALIQEMNATAGETELTDKEAAFVDEMAQGGPVSGMQLLWLRDIKDELL